MLTLDFLSNLSKPYITWSIDVWFMLATTDQLDQLWENFLSSKNRAESIADKLKAA